MVEKRNGNGQTECFGCKAKGKWSLTWDSFLYTYNGRPYCYDCLKEMLKEFADTLGYNIIKKNPTPKMLPCTCGCKRREHWYVSGDTQYKRTLRCKKCGKEASGKNDTDVINNWNKMIMEERKGR